MPKAINTQLDTTAVSIQNEKPVNGQGILENHYQNEEPVNGQEILENHYQNEEPVNRQEILENTYGLTDEEIQDVNAIQVTISDPRPIVILFGAKTSGKTMTLVRLTRYLRSQGYRVDPDKTFRPSNEKDTTKCAINSMKL